MFDQSLSAGISGTGHALPKTTMTSEDLDRELGLDPGTLERRSGVEKRRVCRDESQIDLAVSAALAAIEDAGCDPAEIDLLISASAVPYQILPTTAPLIIQRLGLQDGAVEAFDVNATCLSFVTALEIAAARIDRGLARSALVVASELASRALPWGDQPEVAALFGDGAGAALLTAPRSKRNVIRAYSMRTYPSGYKASSLISGGTRIDFHKDPQAFAENAVFRMDGPALFKLTHRYLPGFIDDLLDKAGWSKDSVDLVVPHQASPPALDHMCRTLGIEGARVFNISRQFGNQVAASIPIALDMARRAGRVPAGSKLLLLGTAAGVSIGGMAIEA